MLTEEEKNKLISQLRAENTQLKEKERGFENLKSQLMNLEYCYRVSTETISNNDKGNRDTNTMKFQEIDNMQKEIKEIEYKLTSKQRQLRELTSSVYSHKSLLGEKDLELQRILRNYNECKENNTRLQIESKMLEENLIEVKQSYIRAEKQIEDLTLTNKYLNNERIIVENRVKGVEDKIFALRKQLEVVDGELEIAIKNKEKINNKLKSIINAKNTKRIEADQLAVLNTKLEGTGKIIAKKITDLNHSISKSKKQYDELAIILDTRNKELFRIKAGLNYPKNSGLEAGNELRKLKETNENLQQLLDEYRKDVDFQKKLHEIEISKKREAEIEKKKMENETLSKNIEVIYTRKELEKVKDMNDQLLEDKEQLGKELDALKQHAEILKTQNVVLHSELERFTDRKSVV